MLKSIEAVIEPGGIVRLKEPVQVDYPCRAIVTIVDEPAIPEPALLSEPALSEDWSRPDEDAAWAHLQPKP